MISARRVLSVAGVAVSLVLVACTIIACKSIKQRSGTPCERLRSCCHEVSEKAHVDEAPCLAWTKLDPANGGECGYGTDCWCSTMIEKFHTQFDVCK